MARMRPFALLSLALVASACFTEPLDAGPPDAEASSTSEGPSDPETGTVEGTTVVEDSTSDSSGTAGEGDGSSTSGSPSSTGDTGSTSDVEVATCGDGIVEGSEVCDDARLVLEPGACRPDCSGPIPLVRITLSPTPIQGDLGPDPIETVDGLCPPGASALFSDGVHRRATMAPNAVVDPIDWVLHPFTAYENAAGEVLWVTDTVPLLGVRNGVSASLVHSIVPFEGNPPGVLTGMNNDWTSPPQADCAGWSSDSANALHSAGIPWIVDAGGYLDNGGVSPCNLFSRVYCVHEPLSATR